MAGTAALFSDFICMNISPKKLLAPAADAIQALRTKKKIKAMIRISPSKPPPMYMEFPFINDSDAAFDHEDPCFVCSIPHTRWHGMYLEG
jgi:hypothetical protein